MGITGIPSSKTFNPSTADATEIGGVIIPSHNNVAAPIIEGQNNHFPLLFTKLYNEKIPPSPLLSARSVIQIYLMVV